MLLRFKLVYPSRFFVDKYTNFSDDFTIKPSTGICCYRLTFMTMPGRILFDKISSYGLELSSKILVYIALFSLLSDYDLLQS
jgi:hypothetical protein